MSSLELPEYVEKLLDRIIKEHEFSDYSIDIKPNKETGMGSEMFNIKIIDDFGDRFLNVLCKAASSDAVRREICLSKILFKREALFYEKIMPTFDRFQNNKCLPKDNQFLSYPKFYAATIDDDSEQYAIIMEHLEPQDFKLWDKVKPLPIESLRVVMRELGKFHGLSFAMKDQKPLEFTELKQLKDIRRSFLQSADVQNLLEGVYERAINALQNEDYKNVLRDIKNNYIRYSEYCVDDKISERFAVLSHGDFHNNNILYRFNEEGIVKDIRIVDWQCIRYVSPALDILFGILPSTDKLLRANEYDNLIKLYHSSLSTTVKLLGSNPEELFTMDDLRNELKRCGNYVLIWAPSLLAAYHRQSISTNEDCSEYGRRINDLVEDIVNFGYYRKNQI